MPTTPAQKYIKWCVAFQVAEIFLFLVQVINQIWTHLILPTAPTTPARRYDMKRLGWDGVYMLSNLKIKCSRSSRPLKHWTSSKVETQKTVLWKTVCRFVLQMDNTVSQSLFWINSSFCDAWSYLSHMSISYPGLGCKYNTAEWIISKKSMPVLRLPSVYRIGQPFKVNTRLIRDSSVSTFFKILHFIFFCFLYCRKLIDTIDQSEFEGFEYINPLLMSQEDAV